MADEAQIVDFLKRVPLFSGLKEKQLKKIAGRFRERTYKNGDVIVEQGKMGIGLFIMVEGAGKVIRTHGDGTVLEIDTVGPTDFFGELSLLDDMPRSASVVATSDVKCVAMTKLDFLDELEADADMAVVMLKTLAHRFRQLLVQM
jgi:CRP-like cAMP-binding protein